LKKILNSWTFAIILFLLVINFVIQSFVIPSGSMKNTLLIGDNLIASKYPFGLSSPYIPFVEIPLMPFYDKKIIKGREPKRGEIIIFRYPKNPRKHYVKRCVALPGDYIFLKDKNLYVSMKEGEKYMKTNYPESKIISYDNKIWVENPYYFEHKGINHDKKITKEDLKYPRQLFEFPITKIENNKYFMMGDNREHSKDSRFFGQVEYKYLEGIPLFTTISVKNLLKMEFRTDRFFKTTKELESGGILKKAIKERQKEEKN